MEYRQSRDRPVLTMHVDQGPQVEIREVVSVTGQEHVVLANPVPAGGKRARAAEQLRLKDRTYSRRPITRGEVTAHHVWQVMEVDENLVDTCGVERLEPDIDQGPPVDDYHAFRHSVGDGPQPAADAGSEQESLHGVVLRTTPRARMRASASASTLSRPSIPLSQAAYAATESAGVRWGSQPKERSAPISEKMCRVSPNRYSPVTTPGSADP